MHGLFAPHRSPHQRILSHPDPTQPNRSTERSLLTALACSLGTCLPDELRPMQVRIRDENNTKPYQTKPYQTKPYQTKPYQTKPNQTLPNRTKPKPTKPNQTKRDESKYFGILPSFTSQSNLIQGKAMYVHQVIIIAPTNRSPFPFLQYEDPKDAEWSAGTSGRLVGGCSCMFV